MEINTIPEAFQTKLRLAVLSSLLTGKKNFRELKSTTSATDGNLGAQIKKLNELGYVTIEKTFVGVGSILTAGFANSKPQTTCTITEYGRTQFKEYVEMLENLLRQSEK